VIVKTCIRIAPEVHTADDILSAQRAPLAVRCVGCVRLRRIDVGQQSMCPFGPAATAFGMAHLHGVTRVCRLRPFAARPVFCYLPTRRTFSLSASCR